MRYHQGYILFLKKVEGDTDLSGLKVFFHCCISIVSYCSAFQALGDSKSSKYFAVRSGCILQAKPFL